MDQNCDPATLQREDGCCLKNSSQNIPRGSQELKEHSEEWLKLQHIFAPVFEWISELVLFSFKYVFSKLMALSLR